MIPILFIGHSRLEPILTNVLREIKNGNVVFVFLDGPNTQKETYSQLSYKLHELTKFHENLFLRCNDKNLGVALAVPTAIDWFFQQTEVGIICEDDVTISPSFHEYVEKHSQVLQSDSVMMISALNFAKLIGVCSLVRYPIIWGWATSREKWEILRKNISNPSLNYDFNRGIRINSYLASSFLISKMNPRNSWALPLSISMRSNNQSCLMPNSNFVSNSGDDIFATHEQSDIFNEIPPIENEVRICDCDEEIALIDFQVEAWIETNIYKISYKNILGFLKNYVKFLYLNFK